MGTSQRAREFDLPRGSSPPNLPGRCYEDSARELRGTSGALADVLEIADMLSMCKDSPELIRTRLANRKAAAHLGLDADICQALVAELAEELAALRSALGH